MSAEGVGAFPKSRVREGVFVRIVRPHSSRYRRHEYGEILWIKRTAECAFHRRFWDVGDAEPDEDREVAG